MRFVLRLDSSARVRRHIAEVLAGGPVAFDALRDELLSRSLDLGPDPDERLDLVLEGMERIDWLLQHDAEDAADHLDLCFDRIVLIDGVTWAVPISELDVASDTLPSDSLGLLSMCLLNEWCTLDGGGSIDADVSPDSAEGSRRESAARRLGVEPGIGVALPEGWLAEHGATAGGFVLLRLVGDTVEGRGADTVPAPSPALVDALVGTLGPESSSRACRHLLTMLTEAFVLHPELRGAQVPPLADLIGAAGLVQDGGLVARAGFDFEREALRRRLEDVANRVGFRDREVHAYASLLAAWHGWSTNRDEVEPELLAEAVRSLEIVAVAVAFVEEECDPDEPDAMVSFGEALMGAVTGRRRAAPAWLVGQAFCDVGRTDQFEAWTDTALGWNPEHVLAVYDKAWFEFDRGEARKAKALLARFGPGAFEHDNEILDAALVSVLPAAGRNDPCPCGSGRKYKRCHLGVDEVPLEARLTWLYRKANWWLERRHRPQVDAMARLRARNSTLSPGRLLEVDPLIVDAVLSEGGRFDDWLSERGALLPSDEAMLAEQWALVERSVFEVTEVRLDEGMTLRDVRTGDVVEVQERRGTHAVEVGRYVLARPLPTGSGGNQLFGGITTVPDSMLERFIELLDDGPTAADLLLLVARAEAPPTVSNRDGHAPMFCVTTWVVPDAEAAAEALDTVFEPSDEPNRWTWLHGSEDDPAVTEAEGRTVLGDVALAGDRVAVSTNSVERAESASQLLGTLLPDAEVVEELRSDLDEIRRDLAYERAVFGEDDEVPRGLRDPAEAPPEVRAALRQQMDVYEEQWVDESIPALGGATPREALDDPTRRDDLFRLLDRMEEMDAGLSPERRALGMRTSRLRELLGLPPDGGTDPADGG